MIPYIIIYTISYHIYIIIYIYIYIFHDGWLNTPYIYPCNQGPGVVARLEEAMEMVTFKVSNLPDLKASGSPSLAQPRCGERWENRKETMGFTFEIS